LWIRQSEVHLLWLSLDIMVYRSVHNLVKFLLLLTHKCCFRLYIVAFLVSFHLTETGFPRIALRSRVVHQFTCQCCSALYVGQTHRHIHTRVSEHVGVSPLTQWKRMLHLNHVWYNRSQTHAQTPSPRFWYQNPIIRHFWWGSSYPWKPINFST
jgi:hypothetical protein